LAAGKVYKITEDRQAVPPKTDVFASFGGLLMLLKARCARCQELLPSQANFSHLLLQAEPLSLKDLEVDKRIYLLIRRV
jgi:hypothetical protein